MFCLNTVRKLSFSIFVGVLAFVLSLPFVWIAEQIAPIRLNPNLAYSGSSFLPSYLRPRFTPTGRGCGTGYRQDYITNDGERLSEGKRGSSFAESIEPEFRQRVEAAAQIVEHIESYPDGHGNFGQRFVLINKAEKPGVASVSILWNDGNGYYSFIDAPTLDLALEFEKYLISIDYRSPF
jgi:hypothetical protein